MVGSWTPPRVIRLPANIANCACTGKQILCSADDRSPVDTQSHSSFESRSPPLSKLQPKVRAAYDVVALMLPFDTSRPAITSKPAKAGAKINPPESMAMFSAVVSSENTPPNAAPMIATARAVLP